MEKEIEIFTDWIHKDGGRYLLVGFTNIEYEKRDILTVIYVSKDDENLGNLEKVRLFTRELKHFKESFKRVEK